MSTDFKETKKQFLENAHQFAKAYRDTRERAIAVQEAERNKWRVLAAQSDLEIELAEADEAYARTRLTAMRMIREKRALEAACNIARVKVEAARAQFLRTCATGSDEERLAANENYATIMREHFEPAARDRQLFAELRTVEKTLATVSWARKEVKRKLRAVEVRLHDAEAAYTALQKDRKDNCVETQDRVITSAACLTGTHDQRYMEWYLDWTKIGLPLPGPLCQEASEMLPEDVALYCAAGVNYFLPFPHRED